MNRKAEKFVDEYLVDLNAAQRRFQRGTARRPHVLSGRDC